MARAIWTGSVSFGLVNVPVGLYSATEDHTTHFSQFERDTPDRVRYKRVNEYTGEEVDFGDIVKGFDLGGGDYVIVTSDELERSLHSAAKGRPSRPPAAGGTDGLDGLNNDELYQRAQELDLPGRSKMSRDELVQALRRAGTGGPRPARAS